MEHPSFLCLGKCSCCFLSLDQLLIFQLLHFQCLEVSLKFLLFWFFCQLFHPLITTTFFICINKFTFSKFLWLHIQNLLKNSSTQYSQGQLFLLLTLFTSDSTFTSSAATFHFFAIFSSLLTNSLFWLSISVKCHLVLSLREEESTQLHVLLSFCDLMLVHSGQLTNRLWSKQQGWPLIMMHNCYLPIDLWTRELAAKFYFV